MHELIVLKYNQCLSVMRFAPYWCDYISIAHYFARGSGDEHVCVCVCVCVCLSVSIYPEPHARSLPIFCACCLWSWLGPLPAGDEILRGKGSFGGFLPHWQCIVTRSLQMGSAGKGWWGNTAPAKCDLRTNGLFHLWINVRVVGTEWSIVNTCHT